MFEVQVTTIAESQYNKLAHAILYKGSSGPQTRQDEIVVDLSHGTSLTPPSICTTIDDFKEWLGTKVEPRAALYGLGGIGETQIALAYVYWLREMHPGVSISGHASNIERFRQAFASIARECQVSGHHDARTEVLTLIKAWLERKNCSRWLMVLDDADDTELLLRPGRGNAWAISPRVLARFFPAKNVALSSRLEHLPLAHVQTAAAFIQKNSITIIKYLQLLEESDKFVVRMLSSAFETAGGDSGVPRAVVESWVLSFEQIQRQNMFACELLSLMSLFDRQAITLEFLFRYCGMRRQGELALTKVLGIFNAFSFITEANTQGLDMHRLVQSVTQNSYRTQGRLEEVEELSYESPRRRKRVLGDEHPGHELGFSEEEHFKTLRAMGNLASTYRKQGRLEEAEELYVQVVETQKRILGEEDPNLLESMSGLARTYQNQGQMEEAGALERQ
ncbi:hypothetical protein N657DRAFT_631741 [Parathielavia appendiculata]|uniref:Kinesin light chain n=1 Tax=Parathielavia appendiculata TaxID=2587402 RepID=A0AAN6U347_9PEZI|nr:hypothetical protein N657DRAFT_631741 [Parathielavia appendiculata]